MGKPKSKVVNAIVPGPLEQYAPGFRCWLLGKGYTPLGTVPKLQLMAHVSRWLEREGLTAAGLTRQEAGRFLAARHAAGTRWPKSLAGLRPLLDYLGGIDVDSVSVKFHKAHWKLFALVGIVRPRRMSVCISIRKGAFSRAWAELKR